MGGNVKKEISIYLDKIPNVVLEQRTEEFCIYRVATQP